jgi:hypothetical protein
MNIADKIRKLLALANNNSNEAEAALALERATELMMKHGIDEASLRKEIKIGYFGDDVENNERWQQICAQAAGTLLGASLVLFRNNGAIYGRFAGREENALAASSMAAFIIDQVERTYKASLPKGMTKQERAEYRRTFKLACSIRVYGRAADIVHKQAKQGVEGTNALVVVDHRKQLQEETQAFLDNDNVRTRQSRSLQLSSNARGYREGLDAGNSIRLQREINS